MAQITHVQGCTYMEAQASWKETNTTLLKEHMAVL